VNSKKMNTIETHTLEKSRERTAISSETQGAPFVVPQQRFLELRVQPSALKALLLGVLGFLLFVGAWEAAHYATPETSRKFMPPVADVLTALYTLFAERNFLHDVMVSCYRVFVSFSIASLIAVPLGIAMGCFGNLKALLNPILSGWRYLPAASFIPLLLVWFGPTDSAKLALLIIGVIFFLVTLVLDNTLAVPKEFVEASLTMGATRQEVVSRVVVPAAMPAIFDSMRNMIAVGWTYLVIAEIVGAQDGIGAVMMRAGRFLNVDVIMAAILMIGILGVATDLLFRGAQRILFPWSIERR
jgi:NitT/TauT family transport system permease protein